MYVEDQAGDIEEIFAVHLPGGQPFDRLQATPEIWV
jgi:hypothetical protein